MNRNILIGVLVVLLLLFIGYLIVGTDKVDITPGDNTTTTNGGGSNNTGGGSNTGTSETAAAPTVVTNAGGVPTNSTAVVTGRVTPNGAPTTYWYEYGETTALGTRTSGQSIGSGFSPIPSPGYITGLKANTTYYFRLSAENRIGTVNGNVSSFATNNNPPPTGSRPSVNTDAASDITRTGVALNGRVDPNGAATSYWFEYGRDNSFGQVTALSSAGSGENSSVVSESVTGLAPATKYFYRMNAQNQYGTVNGATMNFTTLGPAATAAPTAVTRPASNVQKTTAQLNARIDPNGAATTYSFEYSEDSLLGSLVGTATASQTLSGDNAQNVSADVSGLRSNTKYFYRVVARNSNGTTRGDIVSFTTDR